MRQFRLVHVGVAAALAAATITALGLVQAVGAADGQTSVFVPITPCRLADTRPGADNVGTRATPIGAAEVATFVVWGTNGGCTIPNAATAIASNATAVNPTSSSYLTIFPADANPRPTTSNLNFTAGAAPTPNQVTVRLSAAGAIGAFNNSGKVDLIVDIVGYYVPSTTGSGPAGPAGPTGATGPSGPVGPAGPLGPRGWSSGASTTLVVDDNYFAFLPAFTATANATCNVTSTVQIVLTVAPMTPIPFGAFVLNAIKVNGSNSYDSPPGLYATTAAGQTAFPTVTRSSMFTITAGQSIQFGVFAGASFDVVGATANATVAYWCA